MEIKSEMSGEKSKVQLFVQGSIFLVISNICIKAINFFLLPLYTKNLTPSMLGVSDSITTFTGILFPVLVLGLDSAYSAFYFDKEDKIRNKKVFSTLGITFFVMGIIPIILCAMATPLSNLLFKTDRYSMVVIIALLGVTLNLWYLPFSLELRLRNQMGRFGVVSIITSLSMVLLNILFVTILKLGEMSLILSTAIVSGEYLFLYAILTRSFPQKSFFNKQLLKDMIKFSLPLIPYVMMAWILSLSDRYILLYYFGDASVGLYGIGARFVTLLNVVINAITTAYTTFAFGSKDDKNAKEKYYYIFNVVSLLLIIISFTVAVFSKEIIYIMIDEAYEASYVIIRDMMFGQVFYAMTTIVSYGIIFQKKSMYSLASISAGAIVNLILNFIFIPKFGLIAAAVTTSIGYFVSLMVAYYYSEKLYPCDYGMKRILPVCIATYLISMLLLEASIVFRLAIWGVCLILISILYRDILKTIWKFLMGFMKTLKGRRLNHGR